LVGDHIRDWSVAVEGDRQILTAEFIKPVEKIYQLTVLSEQTIETTPATLALTPPQPSDAERESGSLTISAEDMQVKIDSATGLRQVNAAAGSLAAYRFSARPFALALRLKRIEPVVTASDRATARLEETRLLATHALTLNVEQAGIYNVELQPQPGFVVADVRGEGVELDREAGAAAAGRGGVRIVDFELSADQLVHEVDLRALHEVRRDRIDGHRRAVPLDEDIVGRGIVRQLELVLESGTAAAFDADAEEARGGVCFDELDNALGGARA
jgi:hypothetical protein